MTPNRISPPTTAPAAAQRESVWLLRKVARAGAAMSAVAAVLLAGCAVTPQPEYAPQPIWQAPPVTFWNYGPPVQPRYGRDVPPSYMVLLPNDDGSVGQVHMQGAQGRQVLNQARQGVDIAGPTTAFGVTDGQIRRDFGAAMAARPALPERYVVFFDSGRADRPIAASMDTLHAVVARAQRFSYLEVRVTGHADSRGNPRTNAQLAMARARNVALQLRQMGLRAMALDIESAGEAMPMVQTGDEVADARNRRVEIVLR